MGPYKVKAVQSVVTDKDVTSCSVKSYPAYIGGESDGYHFYHDASFRINDEAAEERFIHVGMGSSSSIVGNNNYFCMTNREGGLMWFRKVAASSIASVSFSTKSVGDTDANFLYLATEQTGHVKLFKVGVDDGSFMQYVPVLYHTNSYS